MLTKELVSKQLDNLPEKFSVDQLFEKIILIDKIERGIEDIKKGDFFSEEEMDKEFEKWFQE